MVTEVAGTAPPGEKPSNAAARRRSQSLGGFVSRRVAAGLLTLLAVSFFVFIATSVLPGNVAQVVLGKNATAENVAALEVRLDLNHPVLERYLHWLAGAVIGNLGDSAVQVAQGAPSAPVLELLREPLVNSVILAALTILLMVPLTATLGVLAGVHAGRWLDHGISMTSIGIGGMPEFVTGTVLVLIFFTQLNVLPPLALIPPGESPLMYPRDLILPVATLLAVTVAAGARQIRAGMIDALQRDYVQLARVNGIPNSRVLWWYALRNALGPSIQITAQNIQYLLGGIVIVESVFSYPGIGTLLVAGVSSRDVTVVQAIAVVLAAVYIGINLVADLVVTIITPRLRTSFS